MRTLGCERCGSRIFDYPRFAEPLRERIRQRAQEVCTAAGVQIEHVNKARVRKEEIVARVLAARGDTPGLVHVITAMEGCPSYRPRLDTSSGRVFLRAALGKCLHYYCCLVGEAFGLCWLRVQALADGFKPEQLHPRLKRQAHWLCPVADVSAQDDWHWRIRQAEYSTDLMFRSSHALVPLYDASSRQALLAADAPRVAGFLGKKVTSQLAQEIGSRLCTRIQGRCVKHYMGAAGVKVYDKFSRMLRVGTTVNNLSFLPGFALSPSASRNFASLVFKHHRKVEHKGATATRELAPLKKSILLPDRPARDSVGLPPALPGVPVQPGRPQLRRA